MLGWMHEVGRGVPKDLGESVRWYRRASAQGNTAASDHLNRLETPRGGTSPSPQKKSTQE
jgi:TPR repeat protein